jgi:GNAT superfamily N-acetyltransferase
MADPVIVELERDASLLPSIVTLHISSIERDNLRAHFLPPLDASVIEKWWREQISDPLTTTFVTLAGGSSDEATPTVTGCVMLHTPFSQTEPFTGEVRKLIVSPDARKQGIAKRLMGALEVEAVKMERPMLCLSTEVGSPAESVYPRLGYTRVSLDRGDAVTPLQSTCADGTRLA